MIRYVLPALLLACNTSTEPEAAADGTVVDVEVAGVATVQCGETTTTVDTSGAVSLGDAPLPVTCMVTAGEARGVFQVHAAGSVACESKGSTLACVPDQVR